MKRDSVEINHNAPQWSHNAVWNRKYMEPKTGYTLRQLRADSEPAIGQKSFLLMKPKMVTFAVQQPLSQTCRPPRCLTAPSSSHWRRQQPKMSSANWHLSTESRRNGNAPYAKTRRLRSLRRCKPADRPSYKKMAAKCLLPLSLTGHWRTPRH